MAKTQQQRVGSLTVWMILFVGLWLASTVFLVILYTGQEELRTQAARCENANARLISRAERDSIELVRHAQKGGPTVVGLLEGARANTAEFATGDAADDPAAVGTKLDQILRMIRDGDVVRHPERYDGVSYHRALTTLYEAFHAQHELWQNMEQDLAKLDADVNRLIEANTQQKNDLDKRSQELTDQLTEVEANRSRYRSERNEEVAQLQREFDERRQQGEADLTKERQRSSSLVRKLVHLEDRIGAYQERLGELLPGPQKLATARKPDGKIVKAIPGDGVVYINLGRQDRLVLGLQFAIYSADAGIPADGRAKARIEVVAIYPSSAECRIVYVRGQEVIAEGDLVANPVFDPHRPVSFLVLGQFDLDRDGLADPNGVGTIESMITDWGGELLTEVSALTDFVVLGLAPRRPKPAEDQSSEAAARGRAMQQVYDQYVDTLRWAETLSVPILTQEVFLNFLGYSGRLARR